MSNEDLAGQVLMPYAYGYSATDVAPGAAGANQALAGVYISAQMIAKYRLGRLILIDFVTGDVTAGTNPTGNIADVNQPRGLTTGLQNAAHALPAKVDLLIGTDQEYGVLTRIRPGVVQLPSALALGAGHTPGPLRITASSGRAQQIAWLSAALKSLGVRVVTSGGKEVHLVGYGDGPSDLSSSASVTVAMDTPYRLARSKSKTRIATYSSTQVSMHALAAYLAGKSGAPGRSPVTVSGLPRSACTSP